MRVKADKADVVKNGQSVTTIDDFITIVPTGIYRGSLCLSMASFEILFL